jgi:hypothetical protein
MKVAGQSFSEPLDLEPDPRVKAPLQAYTDELAAAKDAEHGLARASVALDQADKLHDRLAKAIAGADKKTKPKLEALNRRLAALTGVREGKADPNETPTSVSDLSYLAGSYAKLGHAVDGADGGPSQDAREGLATADATLAKTLADWKVLQTEVDAAMK